jgi:hypothetical protein
MGIPIESWADGPCKQVIYPAIEIKGQRCHDPIVIVSQVKKNEVSFYEAYLLAQIHKMTLLPYFYFTTLRYSTIECVETMNICITPHICS